MARVTSPSVIIGLLAAALVLRLYHVVTSYDLFIDEVTYRQIADNLAHGRGLTLYGAPFTLHPASAFLVLAGAIRVMGLGSAPVPDIESLRVVSACVGALLVPGAALLVRRTGAGWLIALVAGLFVAVDPFQISFDSRVMLEPYAQLWTLLCILLLAWAVTGSRGSSARFIAVGAGVSGALAVTTKETFGLVLVASIVVAMLLGALPRRLALQTLAITALGYAANAAYVSFSFGFSTWWDYRTDGLARLLGRQQPTGFNAPTSQVSIESRLAAELDTLIVTYAILVLGGIATLVLLLRHVRRRGRPAGPVVLLTASWAACGCAYLAYATLFGSIEEQMYYIPLLPCTLVVVLWTSEWLSAQPRRAASIAGSLLVVAPLAFNASVWYQVHTTKVNAYHSFVAWAPSHIGFGSTVSATDDTSQFILGGAVIGDWTHIKDLKAHDVDFVVVQTKLVDEGYGTARPHFVERLRSKSQVIFTADSSDDSELIVFDVRPLTGGSR